MTLDAVANELREIRELLACLADRHLSRQEMAARLGVSLSTLDRRVKARSAPPPTQGRWPLSEVLAWERQRRAAN